MASEVRPCESAGRSATRTLAPGQSCYLVTPPRDVFVRRDGPAAAAAAAAVVVAVTGSGDS